jgi:hypothetical protein
LVTSLRIKPFREGVDVNLDRINPAAARVGRLLTIDGRIPSNPAQYVRRLTVHPSERRGLDRGELAASC